MWTDPENIYEIAHRHMDVEIGTEDAQFLFWEYINGIFVAVQSLLLFQLCEALAVSTVYTILYVR
jgi:hypothetical protein